MAKEKTDQKAGKTTWEERFPGTLISFPSTILKAAQGHAEKTRAENPKPPVVASPAGGDKSAR